ncbi:kinesin 2 [Monocercomonoides exilis]|uniref:kinesin 2 n=1 Tax=Monocercomonoides exilis TaxID=2049356 RepID=UPI0035594858|nr:kinesin 2 [Monocercomonoides exilis]|eukprot:MONOS_5651.1-p1 / transcript=MONOS_5651.1 / gene=MONOS_5651 / organism=Monocercomonoides_exilis_PA203 / gene_product=kinesin 2 / transcript_product=kinesin 2 / location=Mono_scaffold00167:23697-27031(-) / protein_length=979 / sequence_SO=supercontig / SO=protein_coding / is_pseudo=false
MSADSQDNVQVMVRCRPLSSKEVDLKYKSCVEMNRRTGMIKLTKPENSKTSGDPIHTFTFDHIYPPDTEQKLIYEESCKAIVDGVMNGFNGCIFAYGQTGTGKTFTMAGTPELPGVTPRSFDHIFAAINQADDTKKFLVTVSYLEIYNEQVKDLLSKAPGSDNLKIHESPELGIHVPDLTALLCENSASMQQVMDRGAKRRTVAATKMNQESSRSHGIFIISIECADVAILDADGKPLVKVGRLNLVDLAGSERQSKTDASGKQLVEAGNINKSLSTLGEVINKLTRKNPEFIPYRNSKLTRLLQDSLGGNSRTVMIANIGPAEYNYEETFSTLRYANRAKQIKNKPVVNCAQDAMVLKMQEEIAKLKKMLEERNTEKIVVADEEIIKKLQIEMEEKAKEKESALESEKERLEEERKKIEQELRRREEEAAKERAEREITARKLKHMEEKVIKGGTHLQDMQAKHKRQMEEMKRKMEEQKKEEERKRVEMEKAKERELEEERKRLLADKETLEIDLRRKHQSLEEEVAHKNKQLEKILQSYKEARRQVQVMDEEMNQLKQQAEDEIKRLEDENEELQTEFEMERNMMIDSIAELQTQLKLAQTIIQLFIPPHEVEKIRERAMWSEEDEVWDIQGAEHSGNALRAIRMPLDEMMMPVRAAYSSDSASSSSNPPGGSPTPPPSSSASPFQSASGGDGAQRKARSSMGGTRRPTSSGGASGSGAPSMASTLRHAAPIAPAAVASNVQRRREDERPLIRPSMEMHRKTTQEMDFSGIETKEHISRLVEETLNVPEDDELLEPAESLPHVFSGGGGSGGGGGGSDGRGGMMGEDEGDEYEGDGDGYGGYPQAMMDGRRDYRGGGGGGGGRQMEARMGSREGARTQSGHSGRMRPESAKRTKADVGGGGGGGGGIGMNSPPPSAGGMTRQSQRKQSPMIGSAGSGGGSGTMGRPGSARSRPPPEPDGADEYPVSRGLTRSSQRRN